MGLANTAEINPSLVTLIQNRGALCSSSTKVCNHTCLIMLGFFFHTGCIVQPISPYKTLDNTLLEQGGKLQAL